MLPRLCLLGPLFLGIISLKALSLAAEGPAAGPSQCVRDASVWRTPPFRPQGFQLEIQISSLGTSYDPDRVRKSIREHNLGEYETVVSSAVAAEWGYSFTHLDGQLDGAGRRIQAGYPQPPASRADCLPVIETFLKRQYIKGADHPWASMNGHFPWHHYAAEFGFDQLGSEIGENINSYQLHIALTRGAARQYHRPWFIDFSAWHGPSITDYSIEKIWGENSGPDHGHSLSLFERALFMSYMAGAGQITAEAGGAISFLPGLDEHGRYQLSPYGEVCKRFRDFTLACPDVGVPLTPFALVLDYCHGAYPGFGKRRAFWHFDYNQGDNLTWDIVDLFWPGGWEVMGRDERGTMVNGAFGDTVDILLQNASQRILNSYPCLVLSGDLTLSTEEAKRFVSFVQQGGTLVVNTAYLPFFPNYARDQKEVARRELTDGKGRVLVYGPDYKIDQLAPILREQLACFLPVQVSSGIEFLVNEKPGSILVTLINNEGVTKKFRSAAVMDPSKSVEVSVSYLGKAAVSSVRNLNSSAIWPVNEGKQVTVTVPPGQVVILEFQVARQHARARAE